MTKPRGIIMALGASVLLASLAGATWWWSGHWAGPVLGVNGSGDVCKEVTGIYQHRLVRNGDKTIIRSDVLMWDEIEIYTLQKDRRVLHDGLGTVDVGDVICSTDERAEWRYVPTGEAVWRG